MSFRSLSSATSLVAILSILASPVAIAGSHGDMIAEGKKITFDKKLGNCISCHMIPGGEAPGNIGPPLIAMKARFPDKAKLRSQINDSTQANQNSVMPPFGRHGILTEKQVDLVTEYIHSL